MELVYTKCKPQFTHQFALSKLKSEGYHLALGSNSIRETIETMIEKAALIDYFDFMLSNQDVKNAKPDPEIYLLAISRLGMNPDECLIVEDNQNGIKAALASGAHLFRVKDVHDVTYQNIKKRIQEIEGKTL
jgi:beta-phosphoglucomutase-like phosphatase (HAD superfamily)